MIQKPLQGVRAVAVGNLLATRVTSKLLSDLGAEVTSSTENFPNQISDLVFGDRPSLAVLAGCSSFSPAALELSKKTENVAGILEFTHSSQLREHDTQQPSERAAASDAGLYESLVPFAQPKVFDQPVCSYIAGIYAAFSLISSLIAREQIDSQSKAKATALCVPLVGAGYSLLGLQGLFAFDFPINWKPVRWMAAPFKDLWKTHDGSYIYVHVGLAQHLQKFFDVLNKNGFEASVRSLQRYLHSITVSDPIEPQGYLATTAIVLTLKKLFLKCNGHYWETLLSGAGLCCIRIRSYEEWFVSDLALQGAHVCLNSSGERIIGETVSCHLRDFPEAKPPSQGIQKIQVPPFGNQSITAPFQNLKVLDFSQVIAGPLAGRTLAEFGADVLRVENPQMKQSFVEPFSAAYQAGKRVLSVDLRTADGKGQVECLISDWKPDVVLHNFARGVSAKLGISEEQLRAVLPNLIYLDINAFGNQGPLSDLPGFEQTAQALAGVAHESSQRGVPKMFLLPIHDMGAGLMGAAGVAAAQYCRLRTGNGAHVHTSLASASMLLQSVHPKRSSTQECSQPVTRGLRFAKLFRKLDISKNWILAKVNLPSGHVVRVVKAPVESSAWQNSDFKLSHEANNSPKQKTSDAHQFQKENAVSSFVLIRAQLAEVGWGIWWVLRQFV